MAFANGYTYRKQLTITSSGLTDYQSAPEDGIVVHYGSGTDSGADVYLSSHCDTSFVDVILTDSADNIIPFEWAFRKPGDYGVLRWKKSSVAASETLRLYYGKSGATYQGAAVDTFVERWNNYGSKKVDDAHVDVTRGWSIAVANRSVFVKDHYAVFSWSRETSAATPDHWIALYDLFTHSVVEMRKVFANGSQDSHAHSCPLIDNDGYVYLFSPQPGATTPEIKWAKSATPWSLDFGSAATIADTDPGTGAVGAKYLQPVLQSDGTIWLFFQDEGFWYVTSSNGGATWSSATELVRMGAGGSTTRVYGWAALDADTDDILVSYSHSLQSDTDYHNLGFLYYDDSAGAWKGADGTSISLPANFSGADVVESITSFDTITSTFGPFITAAGEFAFFYAHPLTKAGWVTDDLRLKRWTGSAWAEDAVKTDTSATISIKARAWESGGTKYLLIGEDTATPERNWRVYSASSWTGTWSVHENCIIGRDEIDAVTTLKDPAFSSPFIICNNKTNEEVIWYDGNAPASSSSWSATRSYERAGSGYFIIDADGSSSYLQHTLAATHATWRIDTTLNIRRSLNRPGYGGVGCWELAGDMAQTDSDHVVAQFYTETAGVGPNLRSTIRDNNTNYNGSLSSDLSVNTLYPLSVSFDGINHAIKIYTDRTYSAVSETITGTHTLSTTLAVIGMSQPLSVAANLESDNIFLSLHYYADQTAVAPTYSAWGSEESSTGYELIAATGSFSGTGHAAALTYFEIPPILYADPGSLAMSGHSAGLVYSGESWAAELEISAQTFKLLSIQYDATKVVAVLGFEADYLNEPACAVRFDPTVAPGLFDG